MNISKSEQLLTERIFMLTISLQLLNQGRKPFHEQAQRLIRKEINKLKQYEHPRQVKEFRH